MNKNYKLVIIIILLLMLLTVVLSVVNHKATLKLVHKQIETQSLPLSLDNIYTDIQKHILEPYLITSMMANDTFIADWLQENEKKPNKVKNYLSAIKKRYGLLSAILVSEKTKAYYTQDGFLETLSPDNPDNSWYFRFKNYTHDKEINIDTNKKIDSNAIMFMNNKIFDAKHNLIGITSTGVKIGSINKMLNMFKNHYKLEVSLYDKNQNIVLSQKDNMIENLKQIKEFKAFQDKLNANKSTTFKYDIGEDNFFVNTKYIPELDLHILVKAKASDFTGILQRTYYMNLIISIFITIFIALIILYIIKSYVQKIEESNAQKDILLKEVHHRVKNNLNITTSMLGLQAMQESDETKLNLLKSKSRIDAIATVHEILYKQDNFNEINFYEYITKLEHSSLRIFNKNKKFNLIIDADKELKLPLDTMIQFGLIVNEMLTNTIKYADNKDGLKIIISLYIDEQFYVFKYRDNGEKYIEMSQMKSSKGLGTKLIEINIKQLGGKLTKYYDNGLCYELCFSL